MKTCICWYRIGYGAVRQIPIYQGLETKGSVLKAGRYVCPLAMLSAAHVSEVSVAGEGERVCEMSGNHRHLLSTVWATEYTVANNLHFGSHRHIQLTCPTH